MLAPERTALVLLAAGQSARFGAANKLEAPFLGRPVGLHVVTALESLTFAARFAVIDGCSLDFASEGYVVLRNMRAALGMGTSLAMGVAAAREAGAEAVLVALADMPRVTAAHILRLFDASDGADTIVASSDGATPGPPALFGAAHFAALEAGEGDRGARDLLRGGRHIVAPPAELIDIDTPEDLAALDALVRRPPKR